MQLKHSEGGRLCMLCVLAKAKSAHGYLDTWVSVTITSVTISHAQAEQYPHMSPTPLSTIRILILRKEIGQPCLGTNCPTWGSMIVGGECPAGIQALSRVSTNH